MMRKYSISKKIMNEFKKQDIITISELYSVLSVQNELENMDYIFKHKVRGAIYDLKKRGKIERVSQSTYKIIKSTPRRLT